MENLTIFTPTYNRGYLIQRCYESLCRQSNKNFVWLIVDDGSTDNTEQIINSFIKEKKIKIIYSKQKNSGKQVAHNTGVLMCTTEIFICLDSDDYLSDNAVQLIYDAWDKIESDRELAGLIALKGKNSSEVVGTEMPDNVERSSIFKLYDKHKFKGDAMLVFKTDILKKHLFPVFEGEKFITEAVVYDQISQKYEMKLLNKVLYFCEYLDDGYSKNIQSVHRENSKGYMYFLEQRIENAKDLKSKYKAVSYYIAGCLEIKSISAYMNCNFGFLKFIALPRGLIIYMKPIIKNKLVKYNIMKF
ncbi:glycosyl transferase family 2 [Bacillus toyonensis]|uniref:glycosyltransferase family 2 protein n=1 Tax=Bacillus toyonensis TaxID=155322 RepID=UPI000BF05CE9|nr:glycosyltransferase family A protein [Bacillus toyonensis]PEN32199.1 glycosyl transferase family 2 [Bacillus toyonensis]PEO02782.1 glycosyl transferase family 2 [Bacillus toyonensis]UFH97688.1 glycosyltransferase family 2 protein [Bacillus toyonensis]